MKGFRSIYGGVAFNPKHGYVDMPVTVPCGQCIGCRDDRVNDWATRMVHEAQFHGLNSFVTLTYEDAHLPEHSTVVKAHVQDFIRSLRKRTKKKISYFAAGEYGDDGARPHYHIIIFGWDAPDKRKYPGKENLFTSPFLDEVWGKGRTTTGAVTPDSCRYTAKYTMKRITGKLAAAHYGERIPEFALMSKKPAIGLRWIQKYMGDTYPSDTIIRNGREATPPRYYDKILKRTNPSLHEQIIRERKLDAVEPARHWNNTPERLAVREEVKRAKRALKKSTL